ncbi:MAG: hypothetical protein H0W40_11445 [Methylibium sp.]|uniref:hypothetical protein n=1 Tax=Methylibium sp. TaxID=2067992 RepID=UPI00178E0C9D|nr:hypothetical protein [Methylibium sp.]MBA3597972.1 hypothetical protein [Methylibium sp.]
MRPALFALTLCAAALLAGCELFDIDSSEKIAALREADGQAVGSACRHAGRAIEDCYLLNPRAQRPAVFAGWREMDEYMRENKLETVVPVLARPAGAAPEAEAPAPTAAEAPAKALEMAAPAKGKPAAS